jgi:indolepyruvate ferredoxin oxidoreductase alpha subunit
MDARIVSGNEAVALGALRAGVKVVAGYPGTPSSGALDSLLRMELDECRHVEWSTNEKVALEIAAGAAWAGQRALCTMKMSGVNVAADSLISVAYSGFPGSLVIYVADDPGANAGMCEQDSRSYAIMSDLPVLEPWSVAQAYELTKTAFELSETTGTPVFVRLVTAIANSYSRVEIEDPTPPAERAPILERSIEKYTKAGSEICDAQHRDLIARLSKAGHIITEMGLNELRLSGTEGGLGIVASGVTAAYVEEGSESAVQLGFDPQTLSTLRVVAANPFPASEVRALLEHCSDILVLEELEPHIEREIHIEARSMGFDGRIIGKLDGTLSRIGEYGVEQVVRGISVAQGMPQAELELDAGQTAEPAASKRMITCCAGCPHRGTYLAINRALRRLKLKRDEVMVTGDIGCTILGMNPPFNTVWNEISMGASVSLAQGFVHSGVSTPVIATIGDSTFFHGGIPGLINAIHHQVPLTLIIMDNGWTAMTGMQVNAGTDQDSQPPGHKQVDLAELVPALGVEHFFVIDPFDLESSSATIQKALMLPGVKVVLSRQRCAIEAMREGVRIGTVRVLPEKCNLCGLCIKRTGCPAIEVGETSVSINEELCYGCGLCAQVCNRGAIIEEGVR